MLKSNGEDLFLRPVDLFTLHDGGDNTRLRDFFNIVMQEITVEHRHIGQLSELDRAHDTQAGRDSPRAASPCALR